MKWFWVLDPVLFYLYDKTKGKDPKEEAPQALEVPETTQGTPIPVLFGTRWMPSPFVGYYGDISIIKVPVDSTGKK